MLFLIALALSILFVSFGDKVLKKYPCAFYIGAGVITVITYLADFSSLPAWVNQWVVPLVSKGALGTALFVVVMYTGAMKNGTKLIAKLMRIRGELSIVAAILVLAHNITYGKIYFRYLFTRPEFFSKAQLAAAVISLILIAIMLVLTITSFPQIRKKMNPRKWKKLQRTAYVFYGLIYVHILLINVPYARRGMWEYVLNVAVYSIVFISYAAMRISKHLKKFELCSVIINVLMVICVIGLSLPKQLYAKTGNVVSAEQEGIMQPQETQEVSSTADIWQQTEEAEAATAIPQETQEVSSAAYTQQQTEEAEAVTVIAQETEKALSTVDTPQETQEVSSAADTPQQAARIYQSDGVYAASAVVDEFGYEISVAVTISEDKVTQVEITENASDISDKDYAQKAIKGLRLKLQVNGGVDGLDCVSGATRSSNAIFEAYTGAIQSAKNN
jgi:DMSO/TMAO reductase YedYZ heme-binding membrane subunit/uncharacterized protein with FMN-binding domain